MRKLNGIVEDKRARGGNRSASGLFGFILLIALIVLLRLFVFELVYIRGDSMLPFLRDGQVVLAEKISVRLSTLKRFDIVTAHLPDDVEKKPVIKRVVALPGETIEITGGKFFVDGKMLDENAYFTGTMLDDMEPVKVPEKCVFLAGDNRDFSLDSRDERVGPIPFKRLIGKAPLRVWPLKEFGSLKTKGGEEGIVVVE